MPLEDQTGAQLVAHYERLARDTAARAERLRLHLAGTVDPTEALYLRGRIARLADSVRELQGKAERLRAALRSG